MSLINNVKKKVNNRFSPIYKLFAMVLIVTNIIYFFVRARQLKFAAFLSKRSEQTSILLEKAQKLYQQTQLTENILLFAFIGFAVFFIFKYGIKNSTQFFVFTFLCLITILFFITIVTLSFDIPPQNYTWQLQRLFDLNIILLIISAINNFIKNRIKNTRSVHVRSIY